MRTFSTFLLLLPLLLAHGSLDESKCDPREFHGTFTGEIKSVLYVTDVERATPFYRDVLGFDFHGFANLDGQPYYAEMSAANIKFALHEPTSTGQQSMIGKQRLYFRLKNLSAHRSRVLAWGINAGEIKITDWMDMFIMNDPDGNDIIFAVTDPERHSVNPWNTANLFTEDDKSAE